MQRFINLQNISPYLTCSLCHGYLIDATTIVECLHSFCRSCILHHLESSYNCPKCNTEIHKTKPLEYIRSDPCLQEIVYKLVPNLYADEERRREQWKNESDKKDDPGPSKSNVGTLEDARILVTFKYFRGTSRMERIKAEQVLQLFPTRYLCCQTGMPIRVLKKFVRHKFDISADLFEIDLWRGDETLRDELTLKQLIQIYGLFRERKPLELHFSLYPKFVNFIKTEKNSGKAIKHESTAEANNTGSSKIDIKEDTTQPSLELISDTKVLYPKSTEVAVTDDKCFQVKNSELQNQNAKNSHETGANDKHNKLTFHTDSSTTSKMNDLNQENVSTEFSNDMDTS